MSWGDKTLGKGSLGKWQPRKASVPGDSEFWKGGDLISAGLSGVMVKTFPRSLVGINLSWWQDGVGSRVGHLGGTQRDLNGKRELGHSEGGFGS